MWVLGETAWIRVHPKSKPWEEKGEDGHEDRAEARGVTSGAGPREGAGHGVWPTASQAPLPLGEATLLFRAWTWPFVLASWKST